MTNMNIVDRVVERLKLSPVGNLITEEDLHDIVKQAIPKTFFEERKVTEGYHTRTLPPAIYEIMQAVMREHLEAAIKEWAKDNPETIASYWKEVMDKGLHSYVQQVADAKASDAIRSALAPWLQQVNNERMNAGLPQIYI